MFWKRKIQITWTLIAIKNSIRSQFHVDLNSVIRFEAGAGQLRENCIEKKKQFTGRNVDGSFVWNKIFRWRAIKDRYRREWDEWRVRDEVRLDDFAMLIQLYPIWTGFCIWKMSICEVGLW